MQEKFLILALITACLGFLSQLISLISNLPEIARFLKTALTSGLRLFKKIQLVLPQTYQSLIKAAISAGLGISKKVRMLHATLMGSKISVVHSKKPDVLINTFKKSDVLTEHSNLLLICPACHGPF